MEKQFAHEKLQSHGCLTKNAYLYDNLWLINCNQDKIYYIDFKGKRSEAI